MIWDEVTTLESSRLALRDHVTETLHGLEAGSGPAGLEDIADGVALFCLQAEQTTLLSDDFIALALARALHGVGQDQLAERVVARETAPGRSLSQYLPLIRAGAQVPGLWRTCASGVIRPACVSAEAGQTVWVVDTTRLQEQQADLLELTMITVLRTVLEAAAPLWGECGGQGALALLAKPSAGGRPVNVEEWLDYCRDVLRRQAEARKWPEIPRVLRLDIPRFQRKRRSSR